MSAFDSPGKAVERWLDQRSDPAPATLRARMTQAVDRLPTDTPASIADLSSRAGEGLLARLLTEGCAPRSAAPDLLAADALVTYAFEAVADDTTATARAISERAAQTMLRIARLGGDA